MSSRYVPKSRRNQNQGNDNFGTSNWGSSNSRNNGYNDYNQNQFGSEEEEARYYKQQTDAVMDETLATSRNILKKLDQTEQIGVQNMNLLAESDGKLENKKIFFSKKKKKKKFFFKKKKKKTIIIILINK